MAKKGSNTSSSTTSPNPVAAADYYSVLNRAQQVAATPYQGYTGEWVAPVNQEQQAGIGNINNYANFASPYITGAAGYANALAKPLSTQDIQEYMNPWTDEVTAKTLQDFDWSNRQQQSALVGNAAAQNALGGNRVGVAQAELAGQQSRVQNPIIAGLRSQGYGQAVQTAEQQKQDTGNAAYGLANIGLSGQTAGLQGAGAQIQGGTLQQQTQQGLDTALFNEFMRQQGFPYQQTQWLAGIDTGVGSNLGGTSTTRGPEPNRLAQNIGMGLAAAGLFLKRGGGVRGYDDGGGIMPYSGASSYIPGLGIHAGKGAPEPPKLGDSKGGSGGAGGLGGISGLAGKLGGLLPQGMNFLSTDTPGNDSGIYTGPAWEPGFPQGGGSDFGFPDLGFSSVTGGLARGGFVPPDEGFGIRIPRGYQDGGSPTMAGFGTGSMIDDRFGDWPRGVDLSDQQITTRDPDKLLGYGYGLNSYNELPNDEPTQVASPYDDSEEDGTTALGFAPQGRQQTAGIQGVFPSGQDDSDLPENAGPAEGILPGGLLGLLGRRQQTEDQGQGGGLLGLSQPARTGLMSAGLNMIAQARGSHPSSAIGVGAVAGFGDYQKERAFEQKQMTERQKMLLAEERIRQAEKRADAMLKVQQDRLTFQQSLPRVIGQTTDADGNKINVYGVPDGKGGTKPLPHLPPEITTPGVTPGAAPAPGTPPGPTSSAPGNVKVASLEPNVMNDGTVIANSKTLAQGPYDYSKDSPYMEKGLQVPQPAALAGHSSQALQTDAEYYLTTGKLPPVRSGKSPVARAMYNYRNAVQNYGTAIAMSRGLTPEQVAEGWRSAPGMMRFILGAQGNQTVSLGTAVRHLNTIEQLARAWQANDKPAIARLQSIISREFGKTAATNLDSASAIVGPEIIKALGVAGAGTAEERETAANQFLSKRGGQQVFDAVKIVHSLLGGQLESKRNQALAAGVSENRFRTLVGEDAYEVLKHADQNLPGVSGAPQPTAADISYARAHPEVRQRFINRFGREP